jgi:hypothetical protein
VIEFFYRRVLEDDHTNFETSSAGSRVSGFNAFINIFPEQPIFGNGEKVTPALRKLIGPDDPFIHIGFLHYLYAFGLLGCFFFFSFCYTFLRRVQRMARITKDYSCFIALIGFLLANWTLVWFRFFDFGLFICFLSLVTKYKSLVQAKYNAVTSQDYRMVPGQYQENKLISSFPGKL